jgi:hypothetical protein
MDFKQPLFSEGSKGNRVVITVAVASVHNLPCYRAPLSPHPGTRLKVHDLLSHIIAKGFVETSLLNFFSILGRHLLVVLSAENEIEPLGFVDSWGVIGRLKLQVMLLEKKIQRSFPKVGFLDGGVYMPFFLESQLT